MSIIDFIKTKEQKQIESKEYFNKVFPHGEVHRDTVKQVIESFFPDHKDSNLFFSYIVIKELHLEEEADEDRINNKTERELKKVRPKLKEKEQIVLMILLSIDLQSPHLLTANQYIDIVNDSMTKLVTQ